MTRGNQVTTWAADQLDRIGGAQEIGLATRPDGSLRPYVTMWVVRAGDGLYVPSPYGIDAACHAKYDRYGPRIAGSVTGPASHAVTIRLLPQGGE